MTDELYNKALIEFMQLENNASIIGEPKFARKVFNPSYWRAYYILYPDEESYSYTTENLIFFSVTGGGIGLVLVLSLFLGIKKHLTRREEEIIENEKLDIQEDHT